MRQWEPHRAQLAETGVERIEDPARDVEMRDGITVKQQQIVTGAIGEREHPEKRSHQSNKAGLTREFLPVRRFSPRENPLCCRFNQGGRARGSERTADRSLRGLTPAGVRCQISRRQMIPSLRRRTWPA